MVVLAAVVAALLGLILRHVACPVLVAASSLPRRHPGLPRVDGAHFAAVWSESPPRGSCRGDGGGSSGARGGAGTGACEGRVGGAERCVVGAEERWGGACWVVRMVSEPCMQRRETSSRAVCVSANHDFGRQRAGMEDGGCDLGCVFACLEKSMR